MLDETLVERVPEDPVRGASARDTTAFPTDHLGQELHLYQRSTFLQRIT